MAAFGFGFISHNISSKRSRLVRCSVIQFGARYKAVIIAGLVEASFTVSKENIEEEIFEELSLAYPKRHGLGTSKKSLLLRIGI